MGGGNDCLRKSFNSFGSGTAKGTGCIGHQTEYMAGLSVKVFLPIRFAFEETQNGGSACRVNCSLCFGTLE